MNEIKISGEVVSWRKNPPGNTVYFEVAETEGETFVQPPPFSATVPAEIAKQIPSGARVEITIRIVG